MDHLIIPGVIVAAVIAGLLYLRRKRKAAARGTGNRPGTGTGTTTDKL